MHYTKKDIENLDRIKRLNLINSVSGIKPANLIGSCSAAGQTNLAIFSSVIHLGSNPGLLGFIVRPQEEVRRHTLENILSTGYYTINQVRSSFIQQAHFTSAKFDAATSEFNACKLTEEYLFQFPAPFVKESDLKLGMKFIDSLPIPINQTLMIIASIEHAVISDAAILPDGQLDLSAIQSVGISGLNSYYAVEKIGEFPYARPENVPDFKS